MATPDEACPSKFQASRRLPGVGGAAWIGLRDGRIFFGPGPAGAALATGRSQDHEADDYCLRNGKIHGSLALFLEMWQGTNRPRGVRAAPLSRYRP